MKAIKTAEGVLLTNSDLDTIKVIFEPTDTIYDVYRKLNEKLHL